MPRSIAVEELDSSLNSAATWAFEKQRTDGHWVGEVLGNVTFTAQYVFLYYTLGLNIHTEDHALRHWILSQQNADGSWGLAPDYPGDVSTTTEAYLALKILGQSATSTEMLRAKDTMIEMGGVEKVRIFTRIILATFGLLPWTAVPQLVPELILLPPSFPLNIYVLSSWARSVLLGLTVVRHHEPLYALPNGRHASNDFLDELWVDPSDKHIPYVSSLWELLRNDCIGLALSVLDSVLYYLGGLKRGPLRAIARRRVISWLELHQEEDGMWGGYWPALDNSIRALILEGYDVGHDRIQRGLEAIEGLIWQDRNGKRMQSTVSPVWDTTLTIGALADTGFSEDKRTMKALEWLMARQDRGLHGDWRVYRPNLAPGGWSFQYVNTWFPDVDDTAAVILSALKSNPMYFTSEAIIRGLTWAMAMQNDNGGWGAFDHNNESLWINRLPFSDMDSLCDPATSDLTGRLIECFGFVLNNPHNKDMDVKLKSMLKVSAKRGVEFLLNAQDERGPWWGRWGSNYLYGSSNVLNGLQYYVGTDPRVDRAIDRCVAWFYIVQNADGGWGEHVDSYSNHERAGVGKTTASQTAWACMALLPYCDPSNAALQRGISWLLQNQTATGREGRSWSENVYVATGFPKHLYMHYVLYPHYFPMMAIGRYRQAIRKISRERGV